MKNLLFFLLFISSLSYGQSTLTGVTHSSQNHLEEANKPLKIGDEEALNIATQHPYNTTVGTTGIVFEKEFYSKKSAYIKLYFKNFNLAPGDYVEITAPNIGESIIYGGQGKIIDANLNMISDFWTQALMDERVIVRLHAQNSSNYYGFDISRVAYGYPQAQIDAMLSEKAICGGDEKEAIICYNGTTMYDKGKAVCRLLINGSGLCTGWLLGCDGHVMTNEHCIGSAADAANTDFMFNYQYTNCNGSGNSTTNTVASTSTFIKTNATLDYTLVKLPVNPTSTYGYLSLSSVAPVVNDRIYIVGHPGGRRKEITVKTDQGGDASGNALVNAVNTNGIRYYADTEGGSSGSPVLDYNSNLVVAIHNTGGCMNGSYGRSDKLITSIGSDMPNCGVDNGGGTTTPPASCGSSVASFPYTESFENTLGDWTQGTGDDFNWATRSGSTPSSNTGPSSANSGSYYIYMESSTPNYSTKQAILNSPCFDLSGLNSPTLSFKYHMYGASAMGNLKLEASTDGTTWTTIWSESGNQGNSWETATVSLSSYTSETELKLRLNGTTGTTWQGDMAVDAFSITGSTTTPPACIGTSLSLTFDNYPEETSWSISNSSGTVVASGGTYASQADGSTLVIDECLDAGCYTLTMNDTYGDGICCAYGNGSYTLSNTVTGTTLASGGSFGSTETKSFCVSSTESADNSVATFDNAVEGTFLNVSPNPFTDRLQIQTNIEGLSNYTLVNLQGQIVKTGSLQNKTVVLDDLSRGVYFITFANDKKQLVRKVIKQ
jgi:V8-like Glu-specific endopeptidase